MLYYFKKNYVNVYGNLRFFASLYNCSGDSQYTLTRHQAKGCKYSTGMRPACTT